MIQPRARGLSIEFRQGHASKFFLAMFKTPGMDHTRDTMEPNARSQCVELLAPAGDWECVKAAVENGADAVYFGLDCGFNARYRAQNFGLQDLPDLASRLHRRGVKGYATLNTLVFPEELASVSRVVEQIASSGIDAVLVQDFGVARLVRAICPDLEIHASTQMSLTSAQTIEVASELGLSRVVLARELSVKEITQITRETEIPIEVFIHGALCVAYSGQCLTSESLGGRSANRGQCAQACRLPYELIRDGVDQDLGDVKYLLSPQDLAGYDSISALADAGVASLKIEGRLKTPEYVANITGHYRKAIDSVTQGKAISVSESNRREMELSFSRGFSPGWLDGNDHKRLVPGLDSAKRGILLGEVIALKNNLLGLKPRSDIALGDGLAIRVSGDGEDQGGRIYSLTTDQGESVKEAPADRFVWIGFGSGEIDYSEIEVGATFFKNDDPKLNRRLRKSFAGEKPRFRRRIDLRIEARVGEVLKLSTLMDPAANGSNKEGLATEEITVLGNEPLSAARKHPATKEVLREKLSRLGGTPFFLGDLEMILGGQPMVPLGMLNQLRRDLVDALIDRQVSRQPRTINFEAGKSMLKIISDTADQQPTSEQVPNACLAVLCRSLEQVKALAYTDTELIYADFHDVREYSDAVNIARSNGKRIGLASVRIQKPSEMGLLKVLLRHEPDLILARNLAALDFASKYQIPVIADFSLNVANHRSAEWIRSRGAQRVTVSYDLNREQVLALINSMPSNWLEIVIHQHMPMFHMEHCVFCSVMSPGTDKTNCGRPCDRHEVKLRDRVGAEHPLQADVACRNTLYNSTPQSGAEIVSELRSKQVNWFRIELLQENGLQASKTVNLYRSLLREEVQAAEVWSQLKAQNRLGVTRGTLETKRNPLAIL